MVTHGETKAANESECVCMPTRQQTEDKVWYSHTDEQGLRIPVLLGASVRFVGLRIDDVSPDFWEGEVWKSWLKSITSQANHNELNYGEVTSDEATFMNLNSISA